MPMPRPATDTGRGKLGDFSLRKEAPPYGITSFTLSRPVAAIATHRRELFAAVCAHAPVRIRLVSGDVADALTLLPLYAILIGVPGMLAEPAVVRRYLGSRSSEAVRVTWLAFLLGKSGQSSHHGCERHHKQSRHHNDTNAYQGSPPPLYGCGGWSGQPPPSCRTIVVKIT